MTGLPSHMIAATEGDFRPAKFEIHLCPERQVPVCGNLVGAPTHLYLKPERETEWKEAASGEHPDTSGFDLNTAEGRAAEAEMLAKFYVPLLGARFNWRWFAWTAKHLVYSPLPEESWPCLRSSATSFSPERVRAALSVRDALWQAERDGLHNLMPLIILFRKDPQALKSLIGKAAWRTLASNAKTRNRAICLLADKYSEEREDRLADMVRFLTTVETSVIRHFLRWDSSTRLGCHPLGKDVITAARQSRTFAQDDIDTRLRLYRDTAALMGFEHRRPNPAWSHKRLRQEHDRALRARIAMLRKEADGTEFCPPFLYRSATGAYTAQRLQSARQLLEEALEQDHCVDLYEDEAKAGLYAVFKITGSQRATLGVHISQTGRGRVQCAFDQATLQFNAKISRETAAFCADVVERFTEALNPDGRGS